MFSRLQSFWYLKLPIYFSIVRKFSIDDDDYEIVYKKKTSSVSSSYESMGVCKTIPNAYTMYRHLG